VSEETCVDHRHEELLRRLAVHDETVLESVLGMYVSNVGGSGLDAKTGRLVRLAGCVASHASPQSYEWSVTASLDAGATVEEVVGVLVALAPVIGVARVNRAAADIATAIGLEIELPGRQ
jgi:alkylhydroperoxidase/carboxymuconolactone decarboxylase family protein YurZ